MSKRPTLIGRYRRALHSETFAGLMLILAAAIALIWANFPSGAVREAYATISETTVGISAIHLNLSLAEWAADGLLAIFFFVVGLELKEEFTTGSLRDVRRALVPILAAVCGMIGPILVYVLIQLITGSGNYGGWAVPVATDIAFALAVLGLFGKGLPPAIRTFLMTLAVVDDLLGIVLIAVFFAGSLNFIALALAVAVIALFGFLVQKRITKAYLLWPLGILAWYLMHLSGVHATIAGVALGMVVPAIQRKSERESLTHHFASKIEFYSAGFILPIFAFFASGVNVVDTGGFREMIVDPVAMGIYLGLPLGKMLGISGGVFIMVKLFKLKLGRGVNMLDILPVSLVAGIGFTVSLLIATLSFPASDPHEPHSRIAVLVGTLLSAIVGGAVLAARSKWRNRYAVRTEIHTSMSPSD
ncbi:NhaA family Na+:H+ antiporter [Arcanobacterium pluranimalium]|uniref:Na+/H+ antiporter NhaA n=1 Tax=Arcanobacterium pluranimalium TaxID=108028 RepID=UPI00308402EA|nr:NhaA family Na+:H+ antiporter [Arcanobacterium pluranimalium]